MQRIPPLDFKSGLEKSRDLKGFWMVIPSKKFILGIGFFTVVLLLAGVVVGFIP